MPENSTARSPRGRTTLRWALALSLTGLTTVAVALPWDVDMADAVTVKAYEQPMAELPEGVVAQPHLLSADSWVPNYVRESPEGQALVNPYTDDPDLTETGERMYQVYCAPCHGYDAQLGPVAQPGRMPGVIAVLGDGSVSSARTDGHIYLTIRNGGAIMPAYGYAMTDREMWSIVHWIRQQPTGAYVPPEPQEGDEP